MDRVFKGGLLVCLAAIAITLFQQSRNGRYQYGLNGNQGVVLDTRNGEFWTEDGSHFEPKQARITARHPLLVDNTADDDRANGLHNCLFSHEKAPKQCVDEFIETRPGRNSASTPLTSGVADTSAGAQVQGAGNETRHNR